jgi:hypothetical protein
MSEFFHATSLRPLDKKALSRFRDGVLMIRQTTAGHK